MNLKNYTSSVPSHTTISYIEAYLAQCGVLGIAKEYDSNKQPSALMFQIQDGTKKFSVRLPANIAKVQEELWKDYCCSVNKPRKEKKDFLDQAARTAWKIQQDWVQVQMSLIRLKQAEPLEVFLPFVWDAKQRKTVFEIAKGNDLKMLPESVS